CSTNELINFGGMTRSISAYPRLAAKPIDTCERTGSDGRFEVQLSNRADGCILQYEYSRGSGLGKERTVSAEPRTPDTRPPGLRTPNSLKRSSPSRSNTSWDSA